jgi:aerobic-type carbon monoxide dehydrogenase small subunit (CoxS/CutS family)
LAAPEGPLDPLQNAFPENQGMRYGYGAPGMIMTAVDFVHRTHNAFDDHAIRSPGLQ